MDYVIGRNNIPLVFDGKLMDCLDSIIRPSITLTDANGFANFDGHNVWSDGENVYYSKGYDQYVLNKSTSTWSPVKWEGVYSFYGSDVWSDGNNTYLSGQYMLDKKNLKWVRKTWNGYSPPVGYRIWKDGETIYYSDLTYQYVLDVSTSTWSPKTWWYYYNGQRVSNFPLKGDFVWTDGKDMYSTDEDSYTTYILDRSTDTWLVCPMSGFSGQMSGYDIFYDGENAYYFNYDLYRFNSEEKSWTLVQSGLMAGVGRYVWTDGENYYSSYSEFGAAESYRNRNYVFDKSTERWSSKEWYGIATFSAYEFLWSDGTNIYLSCADIQLVLNTSTMTFTPKTWYGRTSFSGRSIWTDGENIYYSGGTGLQYVLDKSTSTWYEKTWNGVSSIVAEDIWTDGENIYWSSGTNIQYVLDKSTSTWSVKSWNISPYGRNIWKEGDNIYYSNYMLDKSNSRWIEKTWNGLNDIRGRYVWSDGENTFYSYYNQQYLLHPMSSTWTPIDFGVEVDGMDMWSDGTYMHLGAQCIIDTHTTVH